MVTAYKNKYIKQRRMNRPKTLASIQLTNQKLKLMLVEIVADS